jgi:hypothetical protein
MRRHCEQGQAFFRDSSTITRTTPTLRLQSAQRLIKLLVTEFLKLPSKRLNLSCATLQALKHPGRTLNTPNNSVIAGIQTSWNYGALPNM